MALEASTMSVDEDAGAVLEYPLFGASKTPVSADEIFDAFDEAFGASTRPQPDRARPGGFR